MECLNLGLFEGAFKEENMEPSTNEPLKYYDQNRHPTWLELFFDLIFVVAIGKVTHILLVSL